MEKPVPRRSFLKVVIASAGAMVCQNLTFGQKIKANERLSFYVAGVRFNPSTETMKAGSRVQITYEIWDRQLCYAIYSEAGQRIGYVPHKMIPSVETLVSKKWLIAEVNPTALPWKRYKIVLSDS